MPSHQERVKRHALPAGYQFGDARLPTLATDYLAWQHSGDAEYDRHVRRRVLSHWNVIEGEHFTTNHDHGDEA